jgi:DNA (cytosine-5)-methyltransferase 1
VATHQDQQIAQPVTIRTANTGANGHGIAVDVTHTLDQAQGQAVAQPLPFDTTQLTSPSNYSSPKPGDPCHPLAAGAHTPAAVVYERHDQDARVKEVSVAPTLHSKSDNTCDLPMVQSAMQVRRLTPVECERLQGFPDNHTNIPWRKKAEAPDGPRYKALGNSMAVPVMRWIGERINA